MCKNKKMKQKIFLSIVMAVYALLLLFLPITCPILEITGLPCLGCGMTRALLAALRLDFASAFSYHIMFWSVPILYVIFLYDGKIFKNKYFNILLYGVLLIGYLIYVL